jgi:hypothetical protein
MNKNFHILLILILVQGLACKSQKANLVESETDKMITVAARYTEMPCGGAAPPPDIMEQMMTLRPMANTSLFITTMGKKITEATAVKTDKAGMFSIALDSGDYRVFMVDPVQLSNLTDEATEQELCEQQWHMMNFFPLVVKKGVPTAELVINKMCNPCEEPKP